MAYFFNQGIALVFQEKHEAAIQYLDLALKKDPTSDGIYSFKALALKALGRFDQALVNINRGIMCCKVREQLPALYQQKGQVLIDAGRTQEGLLYFKETFNLMKEINDIDADIITMIITQALELGEKNKWQEAIGVFDIVLELGTWDDTVDWTVEDVRMLRDKVGAQLGTA